MYTMYINVLLIDIWQMMKIVFNTGHFDGSMRKTCGISAEEGLILRTGKEIPEVQHINVQPCCLP